MKKWKIYFLEICNFSNNIKKESARKNKKKLSASHAPLIFWFCFFSPGAYFGHLRPLIAANSCCLRTSANRRDWFEDSTVRRVERSKLWIFKGSNLRRFEASEVRAKEAQRLYSSIVWRVQPLRNRKFQPLSFEGSNLWRFQHLKASSFEGSKVPTFGGSKVHSKIPTFEGSKAFTFEGSKVPILEG